MDKAGDLLDVFRDVLLTARLDDRERFKQVGSEPVLALCSSGLAACQGSVPAIAVADEWALANCRFWSRSALSHILEDKFIRQHLAHFSQMLGCWKQTSCRVIMGG